jgi:hypothetical protein
MFVVGTAMLASTAFGMWKISLFSNLSPSEDGLAVSSRCELLGGLLQLVLGAVECSEAEGVIILSKAPIP